MLFSILDLELNDDFYLKKQKFNPLDEAPPIGFKQALEKWIQNGIVKDNATKAILVDTHYKYRQGILCIIFDGRHNKDRCCRLYNSQHERCFGSLERP
jgi:hypothetical protein